MSRGSETAVIYRQRCKKAKLCVACRGSLRGRTVNLCLRCNVKAQERVVQRRFDARVDAECAMTDHGWITVLEAAEILGLHYTTTYRYISRGLLRSRICYRRTYVERGRVVALRNHLEATVW